MKGNNMKRAGLILFAAAALMMMGACGYQLIGGKGIYGGDITSVYVPVFKNLTYEPHISQPVTDSFSRELISTGLFTLNYEKADGVLKGEIIDITTSPSSLDATGVVIEKSVSVTVRVSLSEKTGILVKQFSLGDSEIYKIQNTAEEYNRREAIRRLSARLARRFSAQLLLEY
ncbi:MAG: LptE family protein [Syntrophorhabdaceae bacterium]|nr:LptE family protein [Syntrophorhabdaceae bacterium]